MFMLLRVVRQFAAGIPLWLLALAGLLAAAVGATLIAGGIVTHQPLVTRGGFIVLMATVLGAVTANRARR
jgi:hypothetical protein